MRALIFFTFCAICVGCLNPQLEIETGRADAQYLSVRIPASTATDFSLTNDFDADSSAYFRLRFGMDLTEKDKLLLELAPLVVRSTGVSSKNIDFAGTTFPSGTDIDGLYQFSTYRLTWRRSLNTSLALGATLLVRDAVIKLEGGGLTGSDDNIGLVPLFSFEYIKSINDKWNFATEGNFAFAPQGRAEDIYIGMRRVFENQYFGFGYRIIEGGADANEVYTFAQINHLAFGYGIKF